MFFKLKCTLHLEQIPHKGYLSKKILNVWTCRPFHCKRIVKVFGDHMYRMVSRLHAVITISWRFCFVSKRLIPNGLKDSLVQRGWGGLLAFAGLEGLKKILPRRVLGVVTLLVLSATE